MRKIYTFFLFTLFLISLVNIAFSQNNFFENAGSNTAKQTTGSRKIFPQDFNGFSMDVRGIKAFLWSLPTEKSIATNRSNAPIMEIPMPDGKTAKFKVWESNIMEPGLAAKFPEMKQFLGQGVDDPYATIRFDYNPYTGLHGQILSAKTGRVFIDPYANGDLGYYMSYYGRDAASPERFVCNFDDLNQPGPTSINRTEAICAGTGLRTYRLALACTGEYAVAVNGPTPTTGGVAAAMLTAVNRVTGVYEVEVAVRLMLVANNDLLIYLNGASDPYTNTSGSTMLGQNQTNVDAVIGNTNYDIGHVFSTGGGGVAFLGVVCVNSNKAGGVTGLPNPVGDAFYIDYVAHEMGHQFGGSHTFNSVTSSCNGNRSASSAYEVGSGTTIQGYAGICGSDNIQNSSDPVFHARSFDQIRDHINGTGSCQPEIATGNTPPVIAPLPANFIIPINTPFTLSGSATDINGDALTYVWEEMDLGPGGAWNAGATSTTAPLFKSRLPKITGDRTFPDIAVIAANYPANPAATLGGLKGETLPLVARDMKFRLTVRDNRAGGGGVVSSGQLGCQASTALIVTTAGAAPFAITSPNGGEVLFGAAPQTITWNNAGTNAAPFNVANVKISLSTDGGFTYPIVLAASTPNDGSESIILPCVATTTARIKIEAIGNIFFDISNTNFTLQTGFAFDSPAPAISNCPIPASMSIVLGNSSCNLANPISLSASGNPAGTTVSFSSNPVAGGSNTTVTLNGTNTLAPGSYNVTVTGTSAGATTQNRVVTYTISAAASATITANPVNVTTCVGGTATFTVVATNASGYQWQVSTNDGGNYSDIPGANSSSYMVTATAAMNGYRYQSVVSAACASAVTSGFATLTVISPVVITSPPAASVICSGANTTFSAAGTSSQPIIYQWQVSTNGGSSYSNISNGAVYSGVTTSILTITGATTSLNANMYRAQLSNVICTSPTSTAGALLTVRQLPTVSLSAAPLTSLLPGQLTTLTATPSPSTGGVISINWQYNGAPATPPISGNSYVVNVETVGSYQVFIQETFSNPALVCANQSAVVTIEATESNRLFIFPSPNDGNFSVSYFNNGGASTKRKLAIFDAKGAQVYNREFAISGAYTLLNVNMERGQRGIYFVVIGDAAGKKLAEGKVHIR